MAHYWDLAYLVKRATPNDQEVVKEPYNNNKKIRTVNGEKNKDCDVKEVSFTKPK